jgi:hypothetical protein
LKEKVSYLEKTEDEQFFLQLELASKRLVEINGLVTKDSRNDISMYLKEYVTRISSIETELLKRTAYLSNFYKSKEFENLQIIFLRQKAALQDHIIPKVTDDNLQSAMFALQSLESIITKAGLRQSSQILDPVVGMTFRFEVPDNSA